MGSLGWWVGWRCFAKKMIGVKIWEKKEDSNDKSLEMKKKKLGVQKGIKGIDMISLNVAKLAEQIMLLYLLLPIIITFESFVKTFSSAHQPFLLSRIFKTFF